MHNCPYCKKEFDKELSLKIHIGLMHEHEVIQAIDKNRPEVYELEY